MFYSAEIGKKGLEAFSKTLVIDLCISFSWFEIGENDHYYTEEPVWQNFGKIKLV